MSLQLVFEECDIAFKQSSPIQMASKSLSLFWGSLLPYLKSFGILQLKLEINPSIGLHDYNNFNFMLVAHVYRMKHKHRHRIISN